MEPLKKPKNHTYQEALEHALELCSPEQVFFAEYQANIINELLKKQGCCPVIILDYGCGDGTMASLMSQLLPKAQIHGIDTSEELIEIAQGWYGAQNDKLSFGTELEKSYDLIYLANVLHHIPKNERTALFKELTTHLAPNGLLIVLEFNPLNPLEVWRFYRNKEEEGNHMIMPSHINKLLSQYGNCSICYYRKIYAAVLKLN